jgi:hypothetical protein
LDLFGRKKKARDAETLRMRRELFALEHPEEKAAALREQLNYRSNVRDLGWQEASRIAEAERTENWLRFHPGVCHGCGGQIDDVGLCTNEWCQYHYKAQREPFRQGWVDPKGDADEESATYRSRSDVTRFLNDIAPARTAEEIEHLAALKLHLISDHGCSEVGLTKLEEVYSDFEPALQTIHGGDHRRGAHPQREDGLHEGLT